MVEALVPDPPAGLRNVAGSPQPSGMMLALLSVGARRAERVK